MADFKAYIAGQGGKAAAWTQNKFLTQHTFGSNGVCGPLSAKWIRDREAKIAFNNDTKSADGHEEVMQLKLNQCRKASTYVSDYLSMFGLSQAAHHAWDTVSIDDMMQKVTSHRGYYFLGLSSMGVEQDFTGHAFAFDCANAKFFDPNFGQASFASLGAATHAFKGWFRLKYLDLRGAAYAEWYV